MLPTGIRFVSSSKGSLGVQKPEATFTVGRRPRLGGGRLPNKPSIALLGPMLLWGIGHQSCVGGLKPGLGASLAEAQVPGPGAAPSLPTEGLEIHYPACSFYAQTKGYLVPSINFQFWERQFGPSPTANSQFNRI